MSKRTELDVLNRNIAVPGCTFTRTALVIEDNEAALLSAGACLQQMDDCGDWWWGDYLVRYAEAMLIGEGYAGADEQAKEKLRFHYVRNHVSVLDGKQRAERQVERFSLARFYNPPRRRGELSNEHHAEAMKASAGDHAVADGWLDQAVDGAWDRSRLRAEIRATRRPKEPDGVVAIEHTQEELFAAKRWARATMKRVDDMEREEACALLADLEPLLALARAVAVRAGLAA